MKTAGRGTKRKKPKKSEKRRETAGEARGGEAEATGGDVEGEVGRLSGFDLAAAPFGRTVGGSARSASLLRVGFALDGRSRLRYIRLEDGLEGLHESATGNYRRGVTQKERVWAGGLLGILISSGHIIREAAC